MGAANAIQSRRWAAFAGAVLVGLIGFGLAVPGWRLADIVHQGSYDSLQRFGATESSLTNTEVVIVYLDLNSYGLLEQQPTRPWSRALHAQLLEKLTRAGAKAVVFDIVFSGPGENRDGDDALAAAIKANGKTILAGESSGKISHATDVAREWVRASTIDPPWERFRRAAAGWGVASHILDDDYTVRRYIAGGFGAERSPSLTWAAAEFVRLPITATVDALAQVNGAFLKYYGPPLTIPHVSYAEALATNGVPDDFFRGKIVFIGARPVTEFFRSRQDEFRSPFHSWGHKELFMPGVEVHATEMLNLLRQDGLRRTGVGMEATALLFAAAVFGAGFMWLRPFPATGAALLGAGMVFGVSQLIFARGVWFPWLIIAGAQIPAALGSSILYHSLEWFRARRRYEARIREQAALIDKAHDAILVQTLEGKVVYANPSAERLYGWRLEEFQRPDILEELFSPAPQVAKETRAAAISSGEWNGELRQQTKSGKIVTVASRWTLIRDAAGRPQQLLLINSDITEQKELEAQFLRTQRMNTIGTLAGGMAHDLNNALAPILMGAQLLRRKAADDESRNLLRLIEGNTQRGAEMVRQVLLFARGRGGEFDYLDLGLLVKEIQKLVCDTFSKSITVESFVPKDLWPVRGNSTQLHQVLLNLCVNARDAMPHGGKLAVFADNVTLDAEEAAGLAQGRAGEFVSLSVSDTGTGMSPEVRAKIFEPFFTTKGEGRGTGIGLSTVARIIDAHQGLLRVDSEPGAGTTFEVLLPRAGVPQTIAAPTQEAQLPRGTGELILVADDEQAIRDLMKVELESSGYRVRCAGDGAELVSRFREEPMAVRLLITDCAMPVLDGPQAITEILELRSDLPIVVTSGADANEVPKGAIVLGKPFSLEELLRAVHRALNPQRTV